MFDYQKILNENLQLKDENTALVEWKTARELADRTTIPPAKKRKHTKASPTPQTETSQNLSESGYTSEGAEAAVGHKYKTMHWCLDYKERVYEAFNKIRPILCVAGWKFTDSPTALRGFSRWLEYLFTSPFQVFVVCELVY
jgi:hypothetical protein